MKLQKGSDALIEDFKQALWKNKEEILKSREDADCVYGNEFYFFDIGTYRVLIQVIKYQPTEEDEDEDGKIKDLGIAKIQWTDTHDEYERTFKNNKNTIEKWLRKHDLIE